MTAENVQAATKAGKQLTLKEAQMILDIESTASWEEIMKKYKHLIEANERNGSFYLQSKIYRARERLQQEFQEQGIETPDFPAEGEQSNTSNNESSNNSGDTTR